MIDIESMRQLDTGVLVTLKQRIERELMRRGDVEQTEWGCEHKVAERDGNRLTCCDCGVPVPSDTPVYGEEPPNTPTPLAKRQLLREPDPGCTRCWGRGTQVSYSNATVALTKLCPCLWGGE